jgi:PAS domain S-box-containing protein
MIKRNLENTNVNEGIITTGSDGIVNFINPFAEALIGASSENVLGKQLTDVIKIWDEETKRLVDIPFESVLKNKKPLINRNHSILISGKKKTPISYDISPLEDKETTKQGVLLVIRGVKTSGKSGCDAEQKLKKTEKELEQFIYIASHDLQEPLRMVTSYVQLLEKRYKGKLDKDADEFIGYAVSGVNRMKNILSALLSYSRLNTRKEEISEIDLNQLIDGIVNSYKSRYKANHAAKVEFEIENLPVIKCNGGQIIQLFCHLIDNAVKFNNSDLRTVMISSRRSGNMWNFSVHDNGIGIDSKYADKVFSMFQRLHSGAEYPGTGVGLALCKKIVEIHGGEIWLESYPGKGSIFHFTLTSEDVLQG